VSAEDVRPGHLHAKDLRTEDVCAEDLRAHHVCACYVRAPNVCAEAMPVPQVSAQDLLRGGDLCAGYLRTGRRNDRRGDCTGDRRTSPASP